MRAVAYVRYSSDNQREESIDAQIRAIESYCRQTQISLIRTYRDSALTAKTDDRPAFQRMIQDAARKSFDAVLVHKTDRFARNRYDSAVYKRQLQRHGVRVISVTEPIDDSPMGVMMETLLEGMAEWYSKNLSSEVMKGHNENALQCKHNGGPPPLGYEVLPDQTYAVNEREARAVRTMFEMYAAGETYDSIIDAIHEQGIRTRRGNLFKPPSVVEIMRNEKYRGVYVYNRRYRSPDGRINSHRNKSNDQIIRVEGGIPRIVSDELWNEVHRRMKNNRGSGNKAKRVYLLTGLIECGNCGKTLHGNTSRSGSHPNSPPFSRYLCATRGCVGHSIAQDAVESVVLDDLASKVFSEEGIQKIAKGIAEYLDKQSKIIPKELIAFQSQYKDMDRKLKNYMQAIENGLYTPEMNDAVKRLSQEKAFLLDEIQQLKDRSKPFDTYNIDRYREYITKNYSDLKTQPTKKAKELVQRFVKRVIVFPDHIDIEYQFAVFTNGRGEPQPLVPTAYIIKSTIQRP